MKKIFQILGFVFLFLLIALSIFIGYGVFNGTKLDESSKSYAEESIKEITANWSEQELIDRASPELLLASSSVQIKELFDQFKTLGSFQNLEKITGSSRMDYNTKGGKQISADYVGTVAFSNGTGFITIRLIQANDKWQISNFVVNSPSLKK